MFLQLKAIDLMKWMMTVDPIKRPSAHEALSHYWILDRFVDLKSDNLFLNDLTEVNDKDENKQEYATLGQAQLNMANLKQSFSQKIKQK